MLRKNMRDPIPHLPGTHHTDFHIHDFLLC